MLAFFLAFRSNVRQTASWFLPYLKQICLVEIYYSIVTIFLCAIGQLPAFTLYSFLKRQLMLPHLLWMNGLIVKLGVRLNQGTNSLTVCVFHLTVRGLWLSLSDGLYDTVTTGDRNLGQIGPNICMSTDTSQSSPPPPQVHGNTSLISASLVSFRRHYPEGIWEEKGKAVGTIHPTDPR